MKKLIKRINKTITENKMEVKSPFLKQGLLYLPIVILLFYIGMSYVSYLICPLEWPFRYDVRTGIYILVVAIALFSGYLFAARRKNITVLKIEVCKFYNKLLIASALLFMPSCYYKTSALFPPIISSLVNPGVRYFETIKDINNRSGYFNLLGCFYIITFAIIILTYYYWEELTLKQRLFGGILAFLYTLTEMSSGKSIGIVVLGISISVCYFSKICGKHLKGKKLSYTFFTFFIIALMLFMFGYNLKSRTGYSVENEVVYEQNLITADDKFEATKVDKEGLVETKYSVNQLMETCLEKEQESIKKTYNTYKLYEDGYKVKLDKHADDYLIDYINKAYTVSDYYRMPNALVYVHIENEIYKSVPDKLKFIYTMGTIYLSNGYHGLSLALYLPFDCCYGLGHIKTIQYYLDKFFGITRDIPSYENKLIDMGWPVGLCWETSFAQFASDFSFIGTIPIMFAMGWLLGKLWIEIVAGGNPITVLLFSFYCVQFFFITSWWYAGLTGGYFITFYLPLFCWIWQKIVLYRK